MPDYPSLEDYREAVLRRARAKADDRSQGEYAMYLTQMSLVREAAKFSGIQAWTHEHTIGALFAASAIKSSVSQARQAGLFSPAVVPMLMHLIDEQENISVQMEAGTDE